MSPTLLADVYGSQLDYWILGIYFVGVLGFGSFFGRFAKSTRDFFFGGQRFSWWLIAMSMAATGIGSYSFLKYSLKGYEYGMSSSMTYTNDWFVMPFFMFGWLPIIYFARVRSVPEYFERRFDVRSRVMAVFYIMLYLLGYIGYNLFTIGKIAEELLGIDLYFAITTIAIISAVYVTMGGQTAVIFTDLLQGFMLFLAGGLLFLLGLDYLGMDGGIVQGLSSFWSNLTLEQRLPFAHFNKPPDFNFVGVFWQDGVAASISFLFISQGLIMRFLAAKSMTEGRRVIFFNTLFILPISCIAVASAGWLGRAMLGVEALGFSEIAPEDPADIFVVVANLICRPGVFGFVLAALTAALMSTIDTYVNACAAIFVYDVYQPYLRRGKTDRHYFWTARWVSLLVGMIGLGLAFVFANYGGKDLYVKHATFIGLISPPIVVAVFLGAFWKGYTPTAAFASMFGGILFNTFSLFYPQVVIPFTWLHGMEPVSDNFGYMRTFFGLVVSALIGVLISFRTKPKPDSEIAGLWVGSINLGRKFFKGSEPSFEIGEKIVCGLRVSSDGTTGLDAEPVRLPDAPASQPPAVYPLIRLSEEGMRRMKASEGDVLYLADARRWLGGLRSLHVKAGRPHDQGNVVLIAEDAVEAGSLVIGRPVRLEKFF